MLKHGGGERPNMRNPLIATTICAALITVVPPATAETTIDVPIKIRNCSSCMINAEALVGEDDGWSQTVRLRKGEGVLHVPTSVADFAVFVRKGKYLGHSNSAALIVMAYTGEEIGSPISNKRSRTSKSGFVCVPPAEGLVIRARVKLMKTPRYKGWSSDQTFMKKYVRAWATPTLPSVPDVYDTGPWPTKNGAAAAQQIICGD
jgi:hypothetical protein